MAGRARPKQAAIDDLAGKLNKLFARVRPRHGEEHSNEYVASQITANGEKISGSYIWQLRKGIKDNPTVKHVSALANFFGVPASYFFDDDVTDRIDQQLEELRAMQQHLNEVTNQSDTQLIAMRTGQLSPERRRLVMDLLEVVYRDEEAERGQASR
jgi:transcriptional regulator with XRE-family HTH domain